MNWWLFGIAMVLLTPSALLTVFVLVMALVDAWKAWPEMVLLGLLAASLCGGAVAMSYAVPQ